MKYLNETGLQRVITKVKDLIAAKYTKPNSGIPKTDLSSGVQDSLDLADTALQSYTEKYTGTITGITMNGAVKGTSGEVDLGTVITEKQTLSARQEGDTLYITLS